MSREQKLVDLCFEMVLAVTSKAHADAFKVKTNEEKAEWVAKTLKECGFETTPCGASWGVLK